MKVLRRIANNKAFKKLSIKIKKYAIYETEDKDILVTDNPVINKPIYFNLFECSKQFLHKLDSTCEQTCMATSKDNYYTEICNMLTD